MKYIKTILALALFGFSLSASSQCTDPDACNTGINTVDEVCLSLEEVTFHDGTIPELGGMTTYRLYLNFPNEGTGVQHALVAVASQTTAETGWEATNTVEITTTTSFYQDQFGSNTSGGINSDLYSTFPTLEFDSWISLGGTNQNEGEVSILSDPNISPGWISDFEAGGNIVIPVSATGGSWYTIPTGANVNLGYSLLLGQFTTNGVVDANFYNILVKTDLDGNGILDDGGLAEGGSTNLYNMSLANNPCTSVASPCVYADPGFNCDGTCINDTDGDGVCDEFEEAGCTDVTACNYDPDLLVTDSDQSLCDFSCIDDGAFASEACENETSFDYNEQTYGLIEIDGRCWFAEDLRTTTYNNGASIDVVTDEVTWAALTEADGPKSTYLTDGAGVGYKSYNWYAVDQGNLCPQGWHVANNADWNSLEKTAFNARPNKLSRRSNMVLGNVQSLYDLGWFNQYDESNVFSSFGFSGGLRDNVSGKWRSAESAIYWWTYEDFTPRSDEQGFRSNSAWARGVMLNGAWERSNALWSTSNNKNNALRVRCVKGGIETPGIVENPDPLFFFSSGPITSSSIDPDAQINAQDTVYIDTDGTTASAGLFFGNAKGERFMTDKNGVLIPADNIKIKDIQDIIIISDDDVPTEIGGGPQLKTCVCCCTAGQNQYLQEFTTGTRRSCAAFCNNQPNCEALQLQPLGGDQQLCWDDWVGIADDYEDGYLNKNWTVDQRERFGQVVEAVGVSSVEDLAAGVIVTPFFKKEYVADGFTPDIEDFAFMKGWVFSFENKWYRIGNDWSLEGGGDNPLPEWGGAAGGPQDLNVCACWGEAPDCNKFYVYSTNLRRDCDHKFMCGSASTVFPGSPPCAGGQEMSITDDVVAFNQDRPVFNDSLKAIEYGTAMGLTGFHEVYYQSRGYTSYDPDSLVVLNPKALGYVAGSKRDVGSSFEEITLEWSYDVNDFITRSTGSRSFYGPTFIIPGDQVYQDINRTPSAQVYYVKQWNQVYKVDNTCAGLVTALTSQEIDQIIANNPNTPQEIIIEDLGGTPYTCTCVRRLNNPCPDDEDIYVEYTVPVGCPGPALCPVCCAINRVLGGGKGAP